MRGSYDLKTQLQLIDAIKANDSVALQEFYTRNYYKTEAMVLKNNGTQAQAKDIYQEAFIAVWNNIKANKFTPQSDSAIHGYLFTISKNKWMDYLRSNNYKKTSSLSKMSHFEISDNENETLDDDKFKSQRLDITMQAFRDLGEPCKSLLRQFYYEKRSMKAIAEELQLDAASTRNKKYRCMQKLRELALKNE